jgi:hypothetical protein
MTEPQLEEAAAIVLGVLKFGALFNPELAAALPFITSVIQGENARIKSGLADGSVIATAKGDFVSSQWAADPRHALNPDGSFKDKSW